MCGMLEKALQVATNAHKGQVDKGGNDYIEHPKAVAAMCRTPEQKVVALLHDTVEDTPVTLQQLKELGFSKQVVDAVDCLTRRDNEDRKTYLQRVKSNALATAVKIADLEHNSTLSRIPHPTERDLARVARYKQELFFLQQP